jgi:short-subunit dehydrogenase
MSRNAIIVGASSGIGLEIARALAGRGYRIALAARRVELLRQHAAELPAVVSARKLDVADPAAVQTVLPELFSDLGTVDFLYLASGLGHVNPALEWAWEEETIRVNALGFAAVAAATFLQFLRQGQGHLIGITSVAAVRGSAMAPAYSATKSFAARYLESLRYRAIQAKLPIHVTDACPGFVGTAMGRSPRRFWVATAGQAAHQIVQAAENRRKFVYVTPRWRLIAWLLKLAPEFIYARRS